MLVRGVAGVVYNEKIYFSSEYPVGCLFCFDIKEGTTQFVKYFFVENMQGMCHRTALLHNHTAWFIPWDGCRVTCVDLETMEDRYFDITNHNPANGHAFTDYIVYKEKELILVPSGMDLSTLMIINMETQEAQCFPDVIPVEQCIGAYVWNDILCFISDEGEVLSEFDLIERKVKSEKRRKKSVSGAYESILQDKGQVYLIPYEASEVVRIDLEAGNREKIPLPCPKDAYWSGCIIEDGILLYPGKYNSNFLKINVMSKKGTVMEWQKEHVSDDWVTIKEIFSNGKEHLAMGTDGMLFLFNEKGALKKSWNYTTEVEERQAPSKMELQILKRNFLQCSPIFETPHMGLTDLISVVLGE